MLRMIESWDTYATAHLTEGRWTQADGFAGLGGFQVAVSPGTGRRGTASLHLATANAGGGSAFLSKTFDPQPTWILGIAFKRTSFTQPLDLCSLRETGTVQVDFIVQVDGTILATRNGTTLGVTSTALNTGTYHFVELKATIHNSTGSVVVRIDGVTALALSGIDTQATANAWVNQVQLGNSRVTGGLVVSDYDDFYLCDGTGAAPFNDFLGDCRVDATIPTSDSTVQWTPSTGTAHYALVDETPPAIADYVEAASAGLSDRYGIAPLPLLTNPQIYAAAVNLYGRNPEAGGRQIAAQMESAATVGTGGTLALTDAWLLQQSLFLADPSTGLPWTQAQLNAAKVGMTVSA